MSTFLLLCIQVTVVVVSFSVSPQTGFEERETNSTGSGGGFEKENKRERGERRTEGSAAKKRE